MGPKQPHHLLSWPRRLLGFALPISTAGPDHRPRASLPLGLLGRLLHLPHLQATTGLPSFLLASSADSWMIVAPEYNGSMPPTLNNAVAWLSTEWQDFRALFNRRKVGLATHSGGGGEHVIMAMRHMFAFLGCIVLGRNCVSNKNKEANPETIEDMLNQLAN